MVKYHQIEIRNNVNHLFHTIHYCLFAQSNRFSVYIFFGWPKYRHWPYTLSRFKSFDWHNRKWKWKHEIAIIDSLIIGNDYWGKIGKHDRNGLFGETRSWYWSVFFSFISCTKFYKKEILTYRLMHNWSNVDFQLY